MSVRVPEDWEARVGAFTIRVAHNCRRFGGSCKSWIRSETHNRRVGGHLRSRHLLGLAADCTYDSVAQCKMAWAAGRSAGLHGYARKGWRSIHWQDRPASVPKTGVAVQA